MTRDDLIIAVPWIIFGAGLSAIGIRLLCARLAAGPGQGSPGKLWRRRPGRPQQRPETISSPETQDGSWPEKKTEARSR